MAEAGYRFRGERQRAAVCRRLLAVVGLSDLWAETGPRSTAWRTLIDPIRLPTLETVFILAAWHVWTDGDLRRLAPAFERIDMRLQRGIEALDCVLRDDARAIDAWLASGSLTGDRWRP